MAIAPEMLVVLLDSLADVAQTVRGDGKRQIALVVHERNWPVKGNGTARQRAVRIIG